MKKISNKQVVRLRRFNEIKRGLSGICMICGGRATDAAHILPRSLFPEHYTDEWNIIPLCRECHNRFDNDLEFRKKQIKIFKIAKEHDEMGAIKYFKKYEDGIY